MRQWPHRAAAVSSESEITLVVPVTGVRQMNRETMAGPMQRAAVTDTATEASEECLEPSQSHGPHRCQPPDLTIGVSRGDDAIRDGPRASEGPRSSLKERLNWVLPLWAADWLGRGLLSRETEVSSTQPRQQKAWLRRAPRGRAPSGSGGKRRTLDSWIRLVNSLEATKRKGAR